MCCQWLAVCSVVLDITSPYTCPTNGRVRTLFGSGSGGACMDARPTQQRKERVDTGSLTRMQSHYHSSSSSDIFAILTPSSRLHTQKHTRTILRPTGVRVGGWHFRRFHYLCAVFSPLCELQLNFIVFLAKSTPLVWSFECDRQQHISCSEYETSVTMNAHWLTIRITVACETFTKSDFLRHEALVCESNTHTHRRADGAGKITFGEG